MDNGKIVIDFLAKEKEAPGQGVHSASFENLGLIREMGADAYDCRLDKDISKADIVQVCDVHPQFFFKMKPNRLTVGMVHFLPDTLNGSIALPGFMMSVFKKYVMAFYRKAKELVVVNPIYRDKLIDLGFDPAHVTYIPNYVSKTLFHPLSIAERIASRQRLGIPEKGFVVLSCGQTQPRKGIYDFVSVAEDNPDVTFVWAGGFTFGKATQDYEKIKKLSQSLPPNVKFLGIVPRELMNAVYNSANLYFSASYEELFPMCVLEASACNVPILVRDLDLYKPIYGDLVEYASDNEGFSKAIQRLVSDPMELAKLGENAQSISNRYSKEAVYAQWDAFYQRILKAHRGN